MEATEAFYVSSGVSFMFEEVASIDISHITFGSNSV